MQQYGNEYLYSLNILKQLKESGIIEITKAHIVIKNFEKLLEEECQPARQTEKQGKRKVERNILTKTLKGVGEYL